MAAEQKPDAVVIAGDIYDRSVPSAEAVDLFDKFVTNLSETLPDSSLSLMFSLSIIRCNVSLYDKLLPFSPSPTICLTIDGFTNGSKEEKKRTRSSACFPSAPAQRTKYINDPYFTKTTLPNAWRLIFASRTTSYPRFITLRRAAVVGFARNFRDVSRKRGKTNTILL